MSQRFNRFLTRNSHTPPSLFILNHSFFLHFSAFLQFLRRGCTYSTKCLASTENVTRELESEDDAGVSSSKDDDDDLSHGEEVVYEATVKDSSSPLFNTRVVLRQLFSNHAKRRGKRAIEVLKRLTQRRLMYHSYSMQVHGYVCSTTTGDIDSFTLVHGVDWFPTLEATLALDEETIRRVGDDTVGGPAVSRQLRLIRVLMRDLLIGVNYLHSHGLAHTELRLENLHISPVDRHIKVGILGNAADFPDCGPDDSKLDSNIDRRKMMIAFDMRCVGFIMAKMVLRDLMDPLIFAKFKAFLSKILDRNWGAGWNLLSLLLATKPSQRISCLDALRHPFLCGPKWRVDPTMDMIRWSLGSTAVRITEEYIYGRQQCLIFFHLFSETLIFVANILFKQFKIFKRRKIGHFIELMEMLNPHSKPKQWLQFLPGKWRLLYSTGRHIGLTLRQPSTRVLIGDVHLKISKLLKPHATFSIQSEVSFTVMPSGQDWAHDKTGTVGKLQVSSLSKLRAGRRLYIKEEMTTSVNSAAPDVRDFIVEKLSSKKWRKIVPMKEFPSSLPVAKLVTSDVEVQMSLGEPLSRDVGSAQNVIREARMQLPPELFDLSKIVCGTYVDSRLLVLRGVSGSALLLARSFVNESSC
ncbi:probable plastid-lipid-associated protein 14 chloroplastic [Phtheirospermum japonicum]|uniref:Probable plastid-lipid-associated protein 14 chloroplastic n=1 Tax=Phtheirospermum japonicum TaxID=374723 RepID=A0A830B2W1_9LAMI|nr:probable plastid-lipid-associated protein 14 chloroplastic [Phtheirospermum japonicum]